jgi:uncharacterized protein (DUF4415 family)
MTTDTGKTDREIRALMQLRDDQIDTSDIPEVKDWSRAVVGRFYRPIKEPVTLRLDADVVAWLKAEGPGYQTRINAFLRTVMKPSATDTSSLKKSAARAEAKMPASPNSPASPVFRFPNLERLHELDKYCKVAACIEKRGCVFAPAA